MSAEKKKKITQNKIIELSSSQILRSTLKRPSILLKIKKGKSSVAASKILTVYKRGDSQFHCNDTGANNLTAQPRLEVQVPTV